MTLTLTKTTNNKMVFNKITMAFPGEMEALFKRKYFSDSLIQFRIAFLLVTILYASFGYLDLLLVPEFAKNFHIIRFYIVVPFLSIVLLLSFTKIFIRIWQELLLISAIVGGAGISYMIILVPDNYAYYAGMMLVFMAGYFFIKLGFFLASIAGWTTLLLYNLGVIIYADVSMTVLISNNFFFISANLIGMFAGYNIEYYARRNFYMNQLLDMQKDALDATNKHLEITVEERTRELVEARNEAIKSDHLKSAFLANMSHEIRTPMNGILGFADLLKNPSLTGDIQQEYIRIIEKSGARMLNIINDIVDISKIESGLMNINLHTSNINHQIDYIYTFFKPEVEAKGMQFLVNKSLPDENAFIKTDREKIYAIFTNLVKNAIKYTDSGSIEFGYGSNGSPETLTFYVKDTGIGIPPDRQEAIFERFMQADIADKSARQGAGLGLSITKAYLEMLGGKIWVESEEGKGSCFYFSIPYIYVPQNPTIKNDEYSDKNSENNLINMKVLIAEDDETSDMFISLLLSKYNCELLHARNGVEAVETCKSNPDIDLVMMDIKMPIMSGYDATKQIRKFNSKVIIIAQTAYALTGDKEKAIEAGCNDYITKPLDQDLLKKLIKKYFNR